MNLKTRELFLLTVYFGSALFAMLFNLQYYKPVFSNTDIYISRTHVVGFRYDTYCEISHSPIRFTSQFSIAF